MKRDKLGVFLLAGFFVENDKMTEGERFFNKLYELSSIADLPAEDKWFAKKCHSNSDFTEMRDELNEVKSLLNSKPLDQWHKHTRARNPAGLVISSVRAKAKPELLTQAWCKFTEILFKFDTLVPRMKDAQNNKFSSLHLCEAPGAFITALNHYITGLEWDGIDWAWVGSTLNPHYEGNTTSEMINDDRFILNTLEHWDFGADDTGDLMDPKNIKRLIEKFDEKGKADLVTADGSINCQVDPARQEVMVCNLHFAEIVSAFGCLKHHGNFVIKMFTFFEHVTLCHLALLRGHFERVHVFKPATSKEGNSEVYVICQGFKSISRNKLDLLVSRVASSCSKNETGPSLFDAVDLDISFTDNVKKCARFFMDLQCEVIRGNVIAFEESYDKKVTNDERRRVAEHFVKIYRIHPISPNNQIMKNVPVTYADDCRHLDDRSETAGTTFMDRVEVKSTEDQRIDIRKRLRRLYPTWMPRSRVVEWTTCPAAVKMSDFVLVYGKMFSTICSSKFCPS